MASTYLTRTPSGAGTNSKIFTLSLWIKRCGLGASQAMMGTGNSSGYNSVFLEFNSNDKLRFAQINAQGASPTFEFEYITTRVFRDVNSWYHIVCTVDSTDSTEADRVKIYVNGVRETSFSTTNHAGSNSTFLWNDARVHSIGRHGEWSARYQNGVMSHIHNIDGTAYQASTFGSTDSTTGEWKINTSPSVTYGTNGWFMLKDDNSVNDDSGNGNNFSLGAGTLTKTEDNPSNVFNVNNPLIVQSANGNHGYGNTNWSTGAASWRMTIGTIGATTGKYYAECQVYGSGGNVHWMNGIVSLDQNTAHSNQYPGGDSGKLGAAYNWDGQQYVNGSNSNYGASYGNNDIIGIAMDLDNRKLYFSKNGTWQNSGDPTSGSTGTGAIDIPSSTDAYTFGFAAHNSSMNCNFGNGYFGGTAVSSAGTNASGIGIFEYDVPTGYTALSTKGLNE